MSGLAGMQDPGMRVEDARAALMALCVPVQGQEELTPQSALGRVLAADVLAPLDVPAHDNAAMDGYALRSADLQGAGETRLAVAGRALAGAPFSGTLQAGQAVRIMTGAVMPAGADAVVPWEKVRVDGEAVILPPGVARGGANVRRRGEDLAHGCVALARGRCLLPADLGLLASLGITRVTVLRRPRVAVFSTGDELAAAGMPLQPGQIYDSNRSTLLGMLGRLGCEALDLGIVPDRPDALRDALEQALAAGADAILTSGGVSAGDADFVRSVIGDMGQVDFHKLAMRPGRPLACGRVQAGGRSAVLVGLPGNPVAAAVAFLFIARPALLRLMGRHGDGMLALPAIAMAPMAKRAGRTEYLRAHVSVSSDGQLQAAPTGDQGSGMLRSMSEANAIIVLAQERGAVEAGERIEVVLFEGLF